MAAHSHQDHHHHHHHHDHAIMSNSMSGIFLFSIIINILFVGVEVIIGLTQNSLSLLSDAGHNLGDVFSLLLVLLSFKLMKLHPGEHYTYGLKKSTVLISLINAILLLVAVGGIIIESIHKFSNPVDVNGMAVSWTAGVGILVNGLTAILLMRGQKKDINIRGAFLHMVTDTLVSVGVVVSGVIITLTGWNTIDPIVSLVIAVIILFSTWNLLISSLRLLVDGTPEGIEPEKVRLAMEQIENVKEVHHVHIWAISTTENALTAHVVIDALDNMIEVKNKLKDCIRENGIVHSTLEFETCDSKCRDYNCEN